MHPNNISQKQKKINKLKKQEPKMIVDLCKSSIIFSGNIFDAEHTVYAK
jgi:hypothetical protein